MPARSGAVSNLFSEQPHTGIHSIEESNGRTLSMIIALVLGPVRRAVNLAGGSWLLATIPAALAPDGSTGNVTKHARQANTISCTLVNKLSLSKAFEVLALSLQESDLELSHSDIQQGLQDALQDEGGCVCDVYGDDDSGDVVYYQDGQHYRAPYEITNSGDQRTHSIDTENATRVVPHTGWDEIGDDDVSEAQRKKSFIERFPGSALLSHRPVVERFISKNERDAADDSSFAGSGRSFPILRKSDVKAAVHSIGRGVAGGQSAGTLKKNIKAIAKRKGWHDALPQSWQDEKEDSDKKDEAGRKSSEGVRLVESAAFETGYQFEEATPVNPLVKIISPGRGSSGYYTKDVLERDGPQIFKRGTLMYINHATPTEEAERPEGDWSKLAAVTTGDAYWDEHGKDGAALYAPAKVFSEYANQVQEKAPYTGVSIRARGLYAEGNRKAPDGKPGLIERLTGADSIDLVTKAGRDGKLLLESANEGDDMDKAELRALIREAVAPLEAENRRLRESFVQQTVGPQAINEALNGIRLPGPPQAVILTRQKIAERLLPSLPIKAGQVDMEKLNEMVEAAAREESRFLSALGYGSGIASMGQRMTEAEIQKLHEDDGKAWVEQFEEDMSRLADIFVGKKINEGEQTEAQRMERKRMRRIFKEGRTA